MEQDAACLAAKAVRIEMSQGAAYTAWLDVGAHEAALAGGF